MSRESQKAKNNLVESMLKEQIHSVEHIAATCKVSKEKVTLLREALGLPSLFGKLTKEDKLLIKKLVSEFKTDKEIEALTGFHKSTIYRERVRSGLGTSAKHLRKAIKDYIKIFPNVSHLGFSNYFECSRTTVCKAIGETNLFIRRYSNEINSHSSSCS